MTWLLFVSLLWAFSFGLIKGNLAGLDPAFVSFARLAISLVLFLPLLRPGELTRRERLELPLIGAVQYGAMYMLYLAAFQSLQAHEVALFTVTTPLLVVAAEGALARRVPVLPLLVAVLAVVGAAALSLRGAARPGAWLGFALLQASNLCFAVGQVRYRHLMKGRPTRAQASHFALLFAGGVVVTAGGSAFGGSLSTLTSLTTTQVWTLLYLGLLPSGVGFFLWNLGASRTTPGVLAVMNNAKVPLGVLVSLVVFRESADTGRLTLSVALVGGALWLAYRAERAKPLAK